MTHRTTLTDRLENFYCGAINDVMRANLETGPLLFRVQFLCDAPAGYVVDGSSRDNAFVRKIGFPVSCKFRTPRDIAGKWVPDATGEPITIGDVLIRNGDYVLADFDGVVIIPAEIAQAVVTEVENVMTAEDKVRAAILSGTDPVDAYLEHGKF